MRAGDAYTKTGFTAAQTDLSLRGGKYGVIITAGTWGSGGAIGVSVNDPNGTPVPVMTAATANNYGTIEVPPCQGTVTVAGTITAGNILISRIPGE